MLWNQSPRSVIARRISSGVMAAGLVMMLLSVGRRAVVAPGPLGLEDSDGTAISIEGADVDIGGPRRHPDCLAAAPQVGVDQTAEELVTPAALAPQRLELVHGGARYLEGAPHPGGRGRRGLDLDVRDIAVAIEH